MNETQIKMGAVLEVLRRRFLTWFLVTVVVGAMALAYTTTQPPIFEARTIMLVDESTGNLGEISSIEANEKRAQTYAYLLMSDLALAHALQEADKAPVSARRIAALRQMVDVQYVRGTQLVTIAVRDPIPARAATLADALVQHISTQMQEMYSARNTLSKNKIKEQLTVQRQMIDQLSASLATTDPTLHNQTQSTIAQYQRTAAELSQALAQIELDEARSHLGIVQAVPTTTSDQPVAPNRLMITLLGLALGLVLGMALSLLLELLLLNNWLPTSIRRSTPRRGQLNLQYRPWVQPPTDNVGESRS
jgi:capsular polysaccharide biosynthesis protein